MHVCVCVCVCVCACAHGCVGTGAELCISVLEMAGRVTTYLVSHLIDRSII